MLDIRIVREQPDFVKSRLALRCSGDEEKIDELLRVDAERRKAETALQALNAERKKLSKISFALPGKRKYPIPDKAHARNALARVAQNGTPAEQKKVKAAVKKRFPSIGKNTKKNKKT